jgi:hypothetical protein
MLLYDLLDMQELQGFVREIQNQVEADRFTLQQYLPNNNIDDIEYRVRQGARQDQDAATVRNWDTESPIARRRAEFVRLVGELPPVSRKIRLGEEERLRRRALDRGNNDEIVDAVYADAANMARAVLARIEMMRGEALVTGALNFNENGVQQTIDFERDPDLEVAAGVPWTAPEAQVVSELRQWRQAYMDANDGEAPAYVLTSERVVSALLLNQQIRELAQISPAAPTLMSPGTVTSVLQAYQIPPFVTYETYVRVEGARQRVIPDDVAIFLPANARSLGETLFGTTAESLELAGAQQIATADAPGLVAVVEKTFDPVSLWTLAAAIGLPVLFEPDRTMVAEVL